MTKTGGTRLNLGKKFFNVGVEHIHTAVGSRFPMAWGLSVP